MSFNYGQSNRQVVQNTNQGRVDPPTTEQAIATGGGARQKHDPNVGKEHRLAAALVETAGSFGQMAVKEKHRRERIEGAKLVADGKATEYINAAEPTFAEKLFGNKPKMRVAQEMQVQQEVGRLDDQMRTWIQETGHKEDTEAFQEKYDEIYNEVADKYDDDPMKDLIASTYAQNLEVTRREHSKAKNLFDQQHLLDTTQNGWSASSQRTAEELNSTDSQVREAAIPKLIKELAKPEAMSQSAYESGALQMAMNDLALGKSEAYAVFSADGAFDNLSFQEKQALEAMLDTHQIKNDSEFNTKYQRLQTLVAAGDEAGAEALGKELQLENPRAVDSINSIINGANAVAQANAVAMAENQRDRQENLEHYRAGRLNLLNPQQQYQAQVDMDLEMKTEAVHMDRSVYAQDGFYPDGHALAGEQVPPANAPLTNAELDTASELPSYQQTKQHQWLRSGGTTDPHVTGLIGSVAATSRLPSNVLAENPEMVEQMRRDIDELSGYADMPGAKNQFIQSFDDPEEYARFERIRSDAKIDSLENALIREQTIQARKDAGLETHTPRTDRQIGNDVKSITTDFKKNHQDRSLAKLGMRQNIHNQQAVDSRAEQLYKANLELFGDHRRAKNQTAWQMNNTDATIGNKFVVGGGEFVAAQEELTPNRDVEDVIGLYLSDPTVKAELLERGIDVPGLITFGREDTRQIRPRLNINTIKNADMEMQVVGDQVLLTLPPKRGQPSETIPISLTSEENASYMHSRTDNMKKAVSDGINTGWDTYFKATELAVQHDEAARIQVEYDRLARDARGRSRTTEAVSDAAGSVKEGVTTGVSGAWNKIKETAGAAPNFVAEKAVELDQWLFPGPLDHGNGDKVSEQTERLREMSAEKQKEKDIKDKATIEEFTRLIAELKAS